MSAASDRESFVELKEAGNAHFKAGRFVEAIECYDEALLLTEDCATLCNRSLAHLRSEEPGSAIADAERALGMDPTNEKANYRLGQAHFAMGNKTHFVKAKKCFRKVLELNAKNREANERYREVTGTRGHRIIERSDSSSDD